MKLKMLKMLAVLGAMVFLTACGSAPATNWPALSSDGETVYLSNGSFIYAVDVDGGIEKTVNTAEGVLPARFPQKADGAMAFYAPVEISPTGSILVGNSATKSHNFFNVDPANGNIIWSFDQAKNTWFAKSLTIGETVFAASGDGNLYRLDLATGSSAGEPIKISDHSLWISPVSDGSAIYVVNMDHQVVALDLEGNEKWTTELDTSILSSPLVADGKLYIGTLSGKLFSIDAASGEILWNSQLTGGIWGTPALAGDALYVGTVSGTAGKVYSLSAANGATIWTKDEEGSVVASPVVHGEMVLYATEAGKLQAMDAAGTPKWQALIENAHFYNAPLVVGESIVMAPMNAEFVMVAYDLNGAQRWTFTGK